MIEFIIPTYNRPYQLLTIMGSILSQNNPNWKMHIVADAIYPGYETIKELFSNIDKIKFTELSGPHNDWGHTPRIYGLENATEDLIVMTGDDNYYTPNFVGTFLSKMDNDINFIYCDMLHNHDTPHTPAYHYFDAKPEINYIDIGNFVTRTSMAKQISFNRNSYAADGEFVEKYIETFCKEPHNIKKIKQALYIHN
jgi:glycosyltransferase involved in cell wall biosynthesis